MNKLKEQLYKLKDKKQQEFLSKLVPTIDKKNILGVKNPKIRALAKEYYKKDEAECMKFIKELPHKYLEEYILHTSILEQVRDYGLVVKEIDKVYPYIDNWATCDTFSPKIVKKHLKDFYKHILIWIKDKRTYIIRFGIQMYMSFYLDFSTCLKSGEYKNINEYNKELIKTCDIVSKIRYKSKFKYNKESQKDCPDKYYVDMMIAWFFATLLAKNYKIAFPYIKGRKLEPWTHNMTIRKAKESFRVSDKNKKELEKYKICD